MRLTFIFAGIAITDALSTKKKRVFTAKNMPLESCDVEFDLRLAAESYKCRLAGVGRYGGEVNRSAQPPIVVLWRHVVFAESGVSATGRKPTWPWRTRLERERNSFQKVYLARQFMRSLC